MSHLPTLINDLAIILGVAAVVTLIFKTLKQPVVLGYILAGLLIGPNVSILPTITDTETIKLWAEIGVIFLLFGLGLEFSFRRLVSIGPSAGITGLFEVSFMLSMGYILGRLLGWDHLNSLFLGGILSISSTTIILRTLEEQNLKSKNFASLVFGVLIIEDLAAIILLVILSTISVTRQFEGEALLFSVLKLLFFLILWFVAGMFFIPTLLDKTKKILNEETILIVSLGLCLGMVLLANSVGFSPALGAFIMGSLLAETNEGRRIEHITKPVKDLFGAIFFVSVGMLIDPTTIVAEWKMILILSVSLILGKTLFATIGALISGQPLKRAIQTGMTLTQIGEFSFIIATLGQTLKVTDEKFYPLAVAVSVTTTFTTPYMVAFSGRAAHWFESKMPQKLLSNLNSYSSSTQAAGGSSEVQASLKSFFLRIIIISTVIIGISLIGRGLIQSHLLRRLDSLILVNVSTYVVTLLLSTPFLWSLINGKINYHLRSIAQSHRLAYLSHSLSIFRYIAAVILIGVQMSFFFSSIVTSSVVLILGLLSFYLFSKNLGHIYDWFEEKFLYNLSPKVVKGESKVPLKTPWEGHMSYFEVSSEFKGLGKTIAELAIRELFGVTIAMIERGARKLPVPGPKERIFPHDKICAIGTDDQLEAFSVFLNDNTLNNENESNAIKDFVMHSHFLRQDSVFTGKTIRNSGIRETTFGLIVGLERAGLLTVNPDISTILEDGDLLWIAGDKEKLKELDKA